MNKQEYKPINLTYYNPLGPTLFKANRSDRERVNLYSCCNSENCDAYKNGKCVMLRGLWPNHACPYGKKQTQTGYTKAARKCSQLVKEYKDKYGDVAYALSTLNHVCRIGDYIYLNLPYLVNYRNPIREKDFFIDEDVIRAEDFTPEFIVELIKYRPRALFDSATIKDYAIKHVPAFCLQLYKYFPDLYEEVKILHPEIEDIVKNFDYKGKKAKVKTLLPGKVKLSNYLMEWDGENIVTKGSIAFAFALKDEDVIIKPNEDTYVEIVDNETVTENTVFKD